MSCLSVCLSLSPLALVQGGGRDIEEMIRGLIQIALLIAFFGMPALGRILGKRKREKPKPTAPPRARGPVEERGRDLWKQLLEGVEEVGQRPASSSTADPDGSYQDGLYDNEANAGDGDLAPMPGTQPKRPEASAGRASAGRGPLAPPPLPRPGRPPVRTQVGRALETGLSPTLSESELEGGRSGESLLEQRGSAEEALERGGLSSLDRGSLGGVGLGRGSMGLTFGPGSAFDSGAADTPGGTSTELERASARSHRLFGRAIDRADLRRSIILAEVLGRPNALRAPDQQPGRLPD